MRVLVIAAALFAGALLASCGSSQPKRASIADCGAIPADKNLKPLMDCMVKAAEAEIEKAGGDTTEAAMKIESQSQKSFIVRENCHIAMHLVGSRLVKRERITLATLQQRLPRSDATNCAGGMTHGMISVLGVTPQKAKQIASSVCASEKTRARQFGCVHGIGHGLRRYLGTPQQAGAVCKTLGSRAVASDCAQGVYHDFFLAAPSAKSRKELLRPKGDRLVTIKELVGPPPGAPRSQSASIDRMCLDQPSDFLRECWYRLVVGPGVPIPIESARDITYACGGLKSEQQYACIAAIATGRTLPEKLVSRCAPLSRQSQRLGSACIDGINLLSVGRKIDGQAERVESGDFWKRKVPFILAACQSELPTGRARNNCLKRVSEMSVRVVPVGVSKQKALSVCSRLTGAPLALCRHETGKAWRENLRFSGN